MPIQMCNKCGMNYNGSPVDIAGHMATCQGPRILPAFIQPIPDVQQKSESEHAFASFALRATEWLTLLQRKEYDQLETAMHKWLQLFDAKADNTASENETQCTADTGHCACGPCSRDRDERNAAITA